MRHFSGLLLCALLLIFCTNARLARYEIHKPNLKLASIQVYLGGEEIRKEVSKTRSLLVLVAVIAIPLLIWREAVLLPVVLSRSQSFEGFSLDLRPRSPPDT
jgi:hypothetical protein